ncbi:MAG TPA: hypothetical protein DCO75_01305 [Fibrobacteres bacterium]|jgi:tRNA-uridine 2-sulfurtransferase|nr:hypothetical protein [Fibrobacterota bacterium]
MYFHYMVKCIVMFSGGLDSTIAVHLLKSLGVDVTALHFVLPFYSGSGNEFSEIKESARRLNVTLRIEEEGEEYMQMAKTPEFGYGKNANPCIDCRIHRLIKAARIMKETGAMFIATGEVVGQRPMSQRRDCLDIIEKKTELRGLLLRPLSAKLLKPTIPETNGWVDRSGLLSICGRGRKDQIAYAKHHGLSYPSPGGGCILTNAQTALRFDDLRKNIPDFSLSDFKLIAYGRHFRLNPTLRLIIARDDTENGFIEKMLLPDDYQIITVDVPGPMSILRGASDESLLELACKIAARYCKARNENQTRLSVIKMEKSTTLTVCPANDEECRKYRL